MRLLVIAVMAMVMMAAGCKTTGCGGACEAPAVTGPKCTKCKDGECKCKKPAPTKCTKCKGGECKCKT